MTKWRKARADRHRAILGLAAACSLVLYNIAGAAQQSGGVFRASTEEGVVYATVFDRAGNLVTNLAREDFEVRVAGQTAPITTFSSVPQPITAVLLIETSIMLADRFFQMRDAATEFINSLEPGDRVRVGSFGSEISISPWLTGDKSMLRSILVEELWPLGYATPLIRAIDMSAKSLGNERDPTTVVVLGVGGMSGTGTLSIDPRLTIDQLRDGLLRGRTAVYGLRFRGHWLNGPELSRLARESGGGDLEVRQDTDLAVMFKRVTNELRNQYLLGFTTAESDGRVQRLEVRVPGRRDLSVRAPRGFVGRSR